MDKTTPELPQLCSVRPFAVLPDNSKPNLFDPQVRKFLLLELQRLSNIIVQHKVKKSMIKDQLEGEIKSIQPEKKGNYGC